MKNPAVWFAIYVQDMPRAKAFYETVFGEKLSPLDNPDNEMWAFPGEMEKYGAPGALVRMAGVASGGNSTLVYFGCEDCAVEAGKAARAGGKIQQPKTSIGQYGHMALIRDTEGNLVGLHSMK